MAGRKSGYRFFTAAQAIETKGNFPSDEFDESDVWGCSIEPKPTADPIRNKPLPSNRKKPEKVDLVTAAVSLPVNIPDWSKILKDEYRASGGGYNNSSCYTNNNNNNNMNNIMLFEGDEDGPTGVVIPPHELLWRNRAASFSVHEGIGRTLKGRDLSRVRNAIFEKTGFQD